MISGVYAILHVDTGRCYVGSSNDVQRRKREHFAKLRRGVHPSRYLQAAWAKHGENAFKFLVLEEVAERTLLGEREQVHLDANKERLLNLVCSAWTTPPVSADFRARIRAVHLGKPKSRAHVEKVRAARLGGTTSWRGGKHSNATRRKMSLAAMGHDCSVETRKKLSEARARQKMGPWSPARRAMSQTADAKAKRSAAAKQGWATIRQREGADAVQV